MAAVKAILLAEAVYGAYTMKKSMMAMAPALTNRVKWRKKEKALQAASFDVA